MRVIQHSNFHPNMRRKCWMKCWMHLRRPWDMITNKEGIKIKYRNIKIWKRVRPYQLNINFFPPYICSRFASLLRYHYWFAFHVNANAPYILTENRSKVKKESAVVCQILCFSENIFLRFSFQINNKNGNTQNILMMIHLCCFVFEHEYLSVPSLQNRVKKVVVGMKSLYVNFNWKVNHSF